SSALPQRMIAMMVAAAAGSSTDFAYLRNAVTALSWDTPLVVVRGTDAPAWDPARHDWDLVRGLKMDLNRPFGDGKDNDENGVVDDLSEGSRPNETDHPAGADGYAVPVPDSASLRGWHLTRGVLPQSFLDLGQPGPNVATLRARQLYAFHIHQLLKSLADTYAFIFPTPPPPGQQPPQMNDPGSRLFAIKQDDADASENDLGKAPEGVDVSLASNVAAQREHTDRVLAQWAVNVVDFLDADAIMTPFRYRQVDPNAAPDLQPWTRHVVWGCEYPDLMITETLAFHDRGIDNTDKDNGPRETMPDPADPAPPPPNADPDFDQVRLPQGSLFVELHATRNPNLPNPPAELYAPDGLLDAGRVAPPNGLGWTAPVWRLSIARRDVAAGRLKNDPFRMLATYPDTEWLMPHGTSRIGGDTAVPKPGADKSAAITPDRYVWLCDEPPPSRAAATINGDSRFPHVDNTFHVRSGPSPLVPRGGYLVIGPRESTALGSVKPGPDPNPNDDEAPQTWGVPSAQRITLNSGQPTNDRPAVGVRNLSGGANPNGANAPNLPPPGNRPETVAAIVTAPPPASWPNNRPGVGRTGIGLSVSEPLRDVYYPEPTQQNDTTKIYDLFGSTGVPNTPFDEDPARHGSLNGGSDPA
ncbi:MAG: hypothetical protein ACKOCX_12370, partial [Planctomycetota bacterium]